MLPNDYARCSGRTYIPDTQEFFSIADECKACRRREPVSEDALRIVMIAPPRGKPLPESDCAGWAVMLPRNVHRCPGQRREVKDGEWPFPRNPEDCMGCARRIEGIRDYMAGADVEWMDAPKVTPCPEKLEPKR